MSYKLPLFVFVVFVVLGLVVFYISQNSSRCNVENYDVFYFLKALRTNDGTLCEKISFSVDKERCLAAQHRAENECSKFKNGGRDFLCVAFAKNDPAFCENDVSCKALINRDALECNAFDSADYSWGEPLTANEKQKIKRGCIAYANLDAEFFISREQLKSC